MIISKIPNLKVNGIVLILLIFSLTTLSAQQKSEKIASSAQDWNSLFQRKQGWFGEDGIFAIPMDGKEYIQANDSTETLFIFSDSVIGEIGSDGTLKKKEDFNFVNNVVAVLKGKEPIAENFTFYYPTDKS